MTLLSKEQARACARLITVTRLGLPRDGVREHRPPPCPPGCTGPNSSLEVDSHGGSMSSPPAAAGSLRLRETRAETPNSDRYYRVAVSNTSRTVEVRSPASAFSSFLTFYCRKQTGPLTSAGVPSPPPRHEVSFLLTGGFLTVEPLLLARGVPPPNTGARLSLYPSRSCSLNRSSSTSFAEKFLIEEARVASLSAAPPARPLSCPARLTVRD